MLHYIEGMASVNRERRSRSDATRAKIIGAAHDEFVEKGFHGATIASIAKRAGVAAQTVYFVFHNKVTLISAVIDTQVMGEDEPMLPQETDWWKAAFAERNGAEALRIFIGGASPLFARASAISEILRAAALTDDELAATHREHEQLRLTAFREVIEMVASKAKLREGLDVESATDIFVTVYGDTTFYLFTVERGWSTDRVVEWFCDVVPGLLLADTSSKRRRSRA
ncbi:MAG: TetR/AcrR family transcriptional regulator [Acidimicrobiales bacterium]|nr:TetR/AcrR family transcriptional regulator [Acidimicrobiales bacterium]